jgi:hypothetical protein
VAFLDTSTGRPVSTGVPGTAGFNSGLGTGPQVAGSAVGGTSAFGSYQDVLQSDPFFKQLLADLAAQGVSDEASARAGAQRGLIHFGEVPEGLDPAYGQWADPQTRELAAKNTAAGFSTVARLQKANKDAVRGIKNYLASRGALRSGELGYQLGEENQRYAVGQYDARSQLVDYLSGISSALANAQRQRSMQQAQGAADAYGRNQGNAPPPAAPAPAPAAPATPETTAPPPTASASPYPAGYANLDDPYALNLGRMRRLL